MGQLSAGGALPAIIGGELELSDTKQDVAGEMGPPCSWAFVGWDDFYPFSTEVNWAPTFEVLGAHPVATQQVIGLERSSATMAASAMSVIEDLQHGGDCMYQIMIFTTHELWINPYVTMNLYYCKHYDW